MTAALTNNGLDVTIETTTFNSTFFNIKKPPKNYVTEQLMATFR